MAPSSLTPVQALVLGLLATAGEATSYDLEQQVAGGVGFFWSFSRSQLYAEPAKLVARGLVEEEREDGGRRRRTYRITLEGRDALDAWLAEPATQVTEIRDLGLLKLFFSARLDPAQVRTGAQRQAEAHRARLATYEELERLGLPAHEAAPLRMGLAYERAAVAFWASLAEQGP